MWSELDGLPGLHLNGNTYSHYPGILNVSAEGVEGESLRLMLEPLCVASGSACNSQSAEPSYVLRALGRSTELAESAIRFSFARETSRADIEFAGTIYREAIRRLRSLLPAACRA
jgi:cysteine desulfurase